MELLLHREHLPDVADLYVAAQSPTINMEFAIPLSPAAGQTPFPQNDDDLERELFCFLNDDDQALTKLSRESFAASE